MPLKHFIRSSLINTGLGNLPVLVLRGPAKGARWTLFPFSMYWRLGGDTEVEVAAARLRSVEGSSFWDFGAHFGIHTVSMALKVGPLGQVVAFEPDAFSFDKLSRHVALNRLSNVKSFCSAVSSESGYGELIVNGIGASTQHFTYPDNRASEAASPPSIKVKTVRADDLVRTKEIRLPNLIKVDVEGHAGSALRGASRSIAENKPVIVLSSHSVMETAEVQETLGPLKYKLYDLEGRELNWSELTYRTRILLT